MVKRKGGHASSSGASSRDEESSEETPLEGPSDIRAIITEAIRETQIKQAERTKKMFKELKEELKNEMKEQLKKFNEDHIALHSQLERRNCSCSDASPAPRLETNQTQPPRFQLRITSKIKETVTKGEIIQTNHGNYIKVDLYDGDNPIAPDHPLASARVMMVVLNGDFNKDNNRYNWSKEDFEKNIRKSQKANLESEDGIVSNCTFYLLGGNRRHYDATIVNNSGNKNVRLGVMMLSNPEERVLEGLSNHFKVQDPPKKSKNHRIRYQNPPSPLPGVCLSPQQLPPSEVQLEHQLCSISQGHRQSASGQQSAANSMTASDYASDYSMTGSQVSYLGRKFYGDYPHSPIVGTPLHLATPGNFQSQSNLMHPPRRRSRSPDSPFLFEALAHANAHAAACPRSPDFPPPL